MDKKIKKPKNKPSSNSSSSKIPNVRMTKTARMRLLKANPLIKYEIEKTNNVEIIKALNLDTVSGMNKAILERSAIARNETSSRIMLKPTEYQRTQPKQIGKEKKYEAPSSHRSREFKPLKSSRRSVSAPRLDKKTKETKTEESLNRSVSELTLKEDSSSKNVTASHIFNNSITRGNFSLRMSSLHSTPKAPEDLKRRLSIWLAKKNKQPSSFKHLKCFGVHKIDIISEANKENVETSFIDERGSYEELKIDCPELNNHQTEDKSLVLAPSDLRRIAIEALKDLHSLISEGYPQEQCEAWLTIIREKYRQVLEEPQYWECRAAIDQLRGDIGSAVESYKNAIIQGAEINLVERSLDQLFQKFNLLDINASKQEPVSTRGKAIQDFKNVFSSMVIKFAIQEKSLRSKADKEQKSTSRGLLVTPVRRSTRFNRSGYTSTPGVKIYSSLQEVDSDVRENMRFQINAAL